MNVDGSATRTLSLSSGCYLEYLGIEEPLGHNNPQTCNPLNFFLLWPVSLCDLMGIKRLPRIEKYWSASLNFSYLRSSDSCQYHRFRQIWSNLHVVDNSTLSGNGLTRKFKPILDVLSRTFLSNYSSPYIKG